MARPATMRAGPAAESLADVLDARVKVSDTATAWLDGELVKLADRVGDELGRLVQAGPSGKVGDATRAQLLRHNLQDVLDILDDLGMDDARQGWFARHAAVAQAAAASLEASGALDDADAALDTQAVRSAIAAHLGRTEETFWDGKVARPTAERILSELHRQALGGTLDDLAATIEVELGITRAQALTEARTSIAEFDRFVAEEVALEVDPTGSELLRYYGGPTDALLRPFCGELVGLVFTLEQVASLNNGQIGGVGGPIHFGGGYNCRHVWSAVHRDDVSAFGATLGTAGNVAAANAAAGDPGRRGKR